MGGDSGFATLTYCISEDLDGGPGQVEAVTGPNRVLTTFDYGQYGQFAKEMVSALRTTS